MRKYILVGALAALFFGALGAMTMAVNDCSDKGGILVRTLMWYACIVGADDDE